jgi:hypothetical protein
VLNDASAPPPRKYLFFVRGAYQATSLGRFGVETASFSSDCYTNYMHSPDEVYGVVCTGFSVTVVLDLNDENCS